MSDSVLRQRNRGAYSNPFSGVGAEFFPLGVLPDHSGFVLHEVGCLHRNDWWDFPNVLSPFWRLYYNSRRGHSVIFADREIELVPDQLMLIPDHQLFHCRGQRTVQTLWLAFSVARRVTVDQPIPILLSLSAAEKAILGRLSQVSTDQPHQDTREMLYHNGMALLHLVLSRSEISWQRNTSEAVLKTVRYIEEYYAKPMLIPKLARAVNLSTESLARAFKKQQGETIGRFIMKVRVREAASRLTNSNDGIDIVAEKTGFPNRAYMSRVFKAITGESPAEFRRCHRIE